METRGGSDYLGNFPVLKFRFGKPVAFVTQPASCQMVATRFRLASYAV